MRATYISPPVVSCIDIQRLQIIRARTILTVRTLARTRRIHYVARLLSKEARHVLPAGAITRQRDVRQLAFLAGDDDVPRDGRDQGADEVVEGVEVVEPVAPEGLHLAVGNENTVEEDEAGANEDRVGEGGEEFVGGVGCDGLADGGVEELVDCE